MILKVLSYKEGLAYHVESSYDPSKLNLDFVDRHYRGGILLDGVVECVQGSLLFRGTLTSTVEKVCARCLEAIVDQTESTFNLIYEIQNKELIDTTDDLRDVLILDNSDRFLCRKDCKGICAQCGSGLNHEACHCS